MLFFCVSPFFFFLLFSSSSSSPRQQWTQCKLREERLLHICSRTAISNIGVRGCFCFKKKKDCGKGYASKKTLWAHKNICKNRNTVPKRREGRKGSPIFTTFLEETSLVMFLISTSMLRTMANLLRPSEFWPFLTVIIEANHLVLN